MFKPWISIDGREILISREPFSDDIRIQFKDLATIDSVIRQLQEVRNIYKEIESSRRDSNSV